MRFIGTESLINEDKLQVIENFHFFMPEIFIK